MPDIKELKGLQKLDGLACDLLNSFREVHHLDIVESCVVMAIAWGRLRKAAEEMGIDPSGMDADFMHNAKVFTEVVDN